METAQRTTIRWWLTEDEELVRTRIIARIQQLRTRAKPRRDMFYRYADFYGTSLRHTHEPLNTSRASRLTFNYAKCYLDTYVSQLCKTRVLPMVATTGGNYEAQRKARGLNLFLEAVFESCGIFDLDPLITRDAAIFGSGILYACEEFGRPVVQRVLPTEIDYDEFEWRNGQGHSLYWSVPMDRSVLVEMYPEQEDAILKAKAATVEDWPGYDWTSSDMVVVRYAWHLPSSPGAGDGRSGAFLDTATLAWSEYAEEDFPFVFFPRSQAISGLWGDSLMSELVPGQLELEFMLERIQESMLLLGSARIFVRRQAKINQEKLQNSNLPAYIIEVDDPGADVREWNPTPITPMAMQYVEMLISKMAAVSTVSPMAAMGEKPTGITAASALELMDDQESERKIIPQRNRERSYVKLAKLLKRICERIPKYSVHARDRSSVVEVSLKDVSLKDEELVYSVVPTSFLAKTAAARVQQAQDLMKLGVLTPERVSRFLDIPDLETETSLLNAQRDNIARRIEKILYDGEYEPPNALLDLNLCQKMAGSFYAMAELNDVPPENLDKLRQWSVACKNLLTPPAPPAPGAPGGPPAPSPSSLGGPMPPPAPPGLNPTQGAASVPMPNPSGVSA